MDENERQDRITGGSNDSNASGSTNSNVGADTNANADTNAGAMRYGGWHGYRRRDRDERVAY